VSNQALGWLRTLVPGALIAACLVPLAAPMLANIGIELSTVADILGPLAVSIPLGWIYESLNVRYLVTDKAHDRINGYVASRLAAAAGLEVLENPPRVFQHAKPTFYRLVDNDKSLSILGDRIRKNGIAWTSSADAALILSVFSILYVVTGLGGGGPGWLWAGAVVGLGAVITRFGVYPFTVENHIALCSDQLDHLVAEYRSDVESAMRALADSHPNLLGPVGA
jgi:hypothetical protein